MARSATPAGSIRAGQSGNDKNNGHECDGNNGIGKGNPAHPGCSASASGVTTTTSTTVKHGTQVLGLTLTRGGPSTSVSGGSLAFTGHNTGAWATTALLLLLAGITLTALSVWRRRQPA